MNNPVEPKACSRCGAPLTPGALQGLCPRCLLALNVATQTEMTGDDAGAHGTKAVPSPAPPTLEEIARHFPGLEILELLGRGGMGAVYKARQKQLDRLVALKILPPRSGDDSAFAERFTREAKALARLNHPGIVTLYEFGVVEGGGAGSPLPAAPTAGEDRGQRRATECAPYPQPPLYYFLMEFVDGVNLRQLLAGGRTAPREALAIVPQICDALQYAHDQGIVHRDIKPENVLLDRRGRVKVADFGLAKLVESNGPLSRTLSPSEGERGTGGPGEGRTPVLTEAGKVMGTPQYMAPEQMQNPAEVDHRADIYALGVVFYQMLTGELPDKSLQPPSKKVQIDVRLDEVVLRALEKDPERRYQQASVLKTQVETIVATPEGTGVPLGGPLVAKGVTPQEAAELGRDLGRLFGRHGLLMLAQQFLLLFDFSAGVPPFVELAGRRRFNFWPFLLLSCSTIGFGVNGLILAFSVAQRVWHGTPSPGGVFPLTAQEGNFLIWAVLAAVGRLAALNLGQASKDITSRRVLGACLWTLGYASMIPCQLFFTHRLGTTSPAELMSVARFAKWGGLGVLVLIALYVIGFFFRAGWGTRKSVKKSIKAVATGIETAGIAAAPGEAPSAPATAAVTLPRPWPLVVVAALFLAGGCWSIRGLANDLLRHTYPGFGVLGIPIGIGLLRWRPGWYKVALVSTWVTFAMMVHLLFPYRQWDLGDDPLTIIEFLGRHVRNGGQLPWVVGVILLLWTYRVLTRTEVKGLFERARTRGARSRFWPEWVALTGAVVIAVLLAQALDLRAKNASARLPLMNSHPEWRDALVSRPAKPDGPFVASLPQGTIELVAISSHPSTNDVWWKPNGSPSREGPFEAEGVSFPNNWGAIPINEGADGDRERGFVIRLIGLPEDALDPVWEFKTGVERKPVSGSGLRNLWPSRAGHPVKDMLLSLQVFPSTARTTTVNLGVGLGPWVTHYSQSIRTYYGIDPGVWKIVLSEPREENGCAVITVAHTADMMEQQARVVAVDNDGQEHLSTSSGFLPLNGVYMQNATFSELPLAKVKEFRFQLRPYRWVQFRNVSLQRGQRTEVEIVDTQDK